MPMKEQKMSLVQVTKRETKIPKRHSNLKVDTCLLSSCAMFWNDMTIQIFCLSCVWWKLNNFRQNGIRYHIVSHTNLLYCRVITTSLHPEYFRMETITIASITFFCEDMLNENALFMCTEIGLQWWTLTYKLI